MTKSDKIKIINNKIKANNVQYNINRLNAQISAFSEDDLDKYEFLTRKDLKCKPNALDKAKFEFSPLGKAFNQGLGKKAENDDNDDHDDNNDDNNDDNDDNNDDDDNDDNDNNDDDDNNDNGDDDGDNGNDEIAETGSIDLSWMNNLQLYRQIAPEVFAGHDRY